MLDSDWCIVGSKMTVVTLDGVEQHIKLVRFTTSRNMTLPSDSGYGFVLMVNSDHE